MMDAKITPQEFDAVLFDMDGVLITTAKFHAATAEKEKVGQYIGVALK